MDTPNPRGAEAAAAYFVELYEYVTLTGDLAEWESASEPECDFCKATRDDVSTLYGAGGRQDGGRVEVLGARSVAFDDVFQTHAVEVHFDIDPATELGPDGAVVREIPAEEGFLLLEVGYVPGDGWKLLSGSAVEEPVT